MNRKEIFFAWALIGLGLISSVGYVTGNQALRGIGTVTVASPLPLVFSAFRGIETFALKFEANVWTSDGHQTQTEINPAVYSRFRAPYNLRNVYGAVISYGPAFKEPKEVFLLDSVLKHGFCGSAPLARDFGLPPGITQVEIRATSMTEGRPGHWSLQARCPKGEAS